jgi:4,5-DOPA dioxygenase extradiol
MTTIDKMPAVFIGHGSPMNTIEHNRYTEAWHDFGQRYSPRSILAISAHWETNGTKVTAMNQPRTIHDFGGFPKELLAVQYPAPGAPDLAARVAEIVKPRAVESDLQRGLDHGTWSVLAHMFPEASVPVVQLSLDQTFTMEQHLQLGASLAPLREEGVLIVASGNVVHNLKLIQWNQPNATLSWAEEFDQAAAAVVTTNPEDTPSLIGHRHYNTAAPTPEHFIPLLHVAGLAACANTTANILIQGPSMGSLSMTSYVVD